MSKWWILAGPVVGVILITVALVIGLVVIPPVIIQQVTDNVRLVNGTEQWDRFVELPIPLDFKVYMFNVTNIEEVQQGMKPIIEEVGPFVYSQYRKKHDLHFSRTMESISYLSDQLYYFNEEKSAPLTQDDEVTILSVHMTSIIENVMADENLAGILPFLEMFLHDLFGEGTDTAFFKTTPRQFLFEGVEFCKTEVEFAQFICDVIEQEESPNIWRSEAGDSLKFAMFVHKNNTDAGVFTVDTGIRRLDRILEIQSWEGSQRVSQWMRNPDGRPSNCQMINGTDGSASAPFREENDDFYIFAFDICRSVQLFMEERVDFRGIPGFRYKVRDNFLNDMDSCFCVNTSVIANADDGCLPAGALDLTECIDAPIIVTLPHFLNADESFNEAIDGLNADQEKHNLFVDIEPWTGSPLRGGSRVQFNMVLRQYPGITYSENFTTPRLFPILWLEESVELNDELVNQLKSDLINVLLIIEITQWTLVGVGAALIIGFLIWFFIALAKSKKDEKLMNESTTM